jgi:hypothetical protein
MSVGDGFVRITAATGGLKKRGSTLTLQKVRLLHGALFAMICSCFFWALERRITAVDTLLAATPPTCLHTAHPSEDDWL